MICFKVKRNPYTLIKKDVLLIDNRFYGSELKNSLNLNKLNHYKLAGKQLSWDDYRRVFYRLMSNPTPAMINVILEKRNELGPLENVVAVHLRCGGYLADTKENSLFFTRKRLTQIPAQINRMIKRRKTIQVMYLTTDSTFAENYIRSKYRKMKVYSLASYQRGHTTSKSVSEDIVKRSILDLYLAAQAKHLVYTDRSSFSKTISYLGNIQDLMRLYSFLK